MLLTTFAVDTGLDVSTTEQLLVFGLTALAALLGGLLGIEREMANKSAGARTHMLVAASAALVVGVGQLLFLSTNSGDPSRAMHAVLTGIGFLCAGAIIRRDSSIEGLTTAASLWFAATVGIAIGFQLYIVGVGAALVGLVILRGVAMLEGRDGGSGDGDDD